MKSPFYKCILIFCERPVSTRRNYRADIYGYFIRPSNAVVRCPNNPMKLESYCESSGTYCCDRILIT